MLEFTNLIHIMSFYTHMHAGTRTQTYNEEKKEKPQNSNKATPIPSMPQLLIFPIQFHNWRPSFQIYEPIGGILIQTAVVI